MSVRYCTFHPMDEPAGLLDEAIRRAVARAIETGEVLNVEHEARRLAAGYPGMASACVADLLIQAGVEARINLALGPRERCDAPAPWRGGAADRAGLADACRSAAA